MLLAAGEIGVSTTLRARCLTAAAAGACASFSTTRLPTCHPQKSSESDSSRSEWTPQSSRHSATTSRSGTGAFVFDIGPGNNGMPPGAVSARCAGGHHGGDLGEGNPSGRCSRSGQERQTDRQTDSGQTDRKQSELP